MKTRDKILIKAQELFNKNGVGKVSVRNICEELQISLGNFTYYFPGKQKIVVELYYRMIAEMEAIEGKITIPRVSIRYILEYHRQLFNIQNQYRFFFLNMFELVHQDAEIKKAFQEYTHRFKEKKKDIFRFYQATGVIREDTDLEFLERLISIGQVVNSFWLIDAELHFQGREKEKLVHYLELCCSLILPHLTDSAWQEFSDYFKALSQP